MDEVRPAMTALERAARAVWDEIARQNGENNSGYAGTYAGRPDYVEGFIDPSEIVRAVLMAVRDAPEVHDHEDGRANFAVLIDAILSEKDATND